MSHFCSTDGFFDLPPPRRKRDRRRGLALAPLLVGGALAVVALAGRSRVGAWLRGFFSAGDAATRDRLRMRLQDERLSLGSLRDSLVGRSKAQVAARFGPPRTAVMSRPGPAAVGQTAFWRADTWYYAIDPATETAMAVKFHHDTAAEVDFFDAPGGVGDEGEAVKQ